VPRFEKTIPAMKTLWLFAFFFTQMLYLCSRRRKRF
jgi:hypothetical protein